MARIGFIGASGLMGHGIAKNLQLKGHELAFTVHRNREAVADLLAAGALEAKNAADLAAGSEIVFICVTGSPQVEAVVGGPGGLLAGAKPGLIVVDCSTSEPDSTKSLRERCAAAGVTLVDAPLARTPVEAEQGRLNVMVGADDAVFARLEPVLHCFAENVAYSVSRPQRNGSRSARQVLCWLDRSYWTDKQEVPKSQSKQQIDRDCDPA